MEQISLKEYYTQAQPSDDLRHLSNFNCLKKTNKDLSNSIEQVSQDLCSSYNKATQV